MFRAAGVTATTLDFERPLGVLAILAAILAVLPRHAVAGGMGTLLVLRHK